MNFKNKIATQISVALGLDNILEIEAAIEVPPNLEMGDYSYPCFRLAKILKKSPALIASELADKLKENQKNLTFLTDIKTVSAYINFYLDRTLYAEQILNNALEQKINYGRSNIGGGRNIPIDYSSPNIAKPFHIGHLRATVIGRALYNIYNFIGYTSIGINHLGDWGTQFGKLIVAYKKWGDKKEIEKKGIEELTRIYVQFHEEAEKDASLEEQARHWMLQMQTGDEEALSLWKWFKDISLIEFGKIYDRLKVDFEYITGESFYNDKMDAVVDELREKDLLTKSQGAMVVDLEEFNIMPCMILRSDGGTLYPTRDVAAAMYRKKTYNFDKCLYVVGLEQKLHFIQWFKVLEKMGYEWSKDLIHVPFGLVRMEEGKFSTRKGRILRVEDILNEAVSKTLEIIKNKNPDLPEKETIAEQVGIGALKFHDLYNSRVKDVIFSWENILNFEGETGPYVQYTHARTCSLLFKSGSYDLSNIDYSVLTDDSSNEVIKLIETYPDKIIESANKYEPYIIARHLINISQAFNKFYHENSILVNDVNIRTARLALVFCVKNLLKSGLDLLGIDAPQQM